MSRRDAAEDQVTLDLSDVEHRVGKPVGGGQLLGSKPNKTVERRIG